MEDSPNTDFFKAMVDELVFLSETDPELKDGLKWLDEQAQKENFDIYDMVFKVLYRHDTNEQARDWLKNRS